MAEAKVPVKSEKAAPSRPREWHPFESLHREIDRLFDDFGAGMWRSPFGRSVFDMESFRGNGGLPAVDVTETERAYEITAELPGMDNKDIDVKLANGTLTIKGEKQDEREEKSLTITGVNAVRLVRSAHFRCPMELTSTKWMQPSTKAC